MLATNIVSFPVKKTKQNNNNNKLETSSGIAHPLLKPADDIRARKMRCAYVYVCRGGGWKGGG